MTTFAAAAPDDQKSSPSPRTAGWLSHRAVRRRMLIRVCALVDRILPISGLGLELTRDDQDNIHLIAATIFVNEPE